jgi:tetratricopeptide (TPR) repeat protein
MSIQSPLIDTIASTQRSLEQAPSDFSLRQKLVALLIQSADTQQALDVVLKAYELHGRDDAVILLHIKLLMVLSRYQEAKTLFASLPKSCYQNPNTLFNYAYCLEELRQSRLAIQMLREYIQPIESFSKCADFCARLLESTDQTQAALAFLEDFQSKTGVLTNNLLITKTNILRTIGELDRADDVAMTLEKESIHSLMCLANLHYDKQDFAAAIDVLWQVIDLEIDNIVAHEFLNKIFWETRGMASFLTSYDKLLAHVPTHLEMQSSKLQLQIIAGQYENARDTLRKIPSELLNHPMVLHIASVIYTRLGDDARAQAALDRCLKIEPQNSRFLIDKSVFHLKHKQYNSANALLQTASKLEPFNQETLAYLAVIWKQASPQQYPWLCDYSNFVTQQNIKESFIEQLGEQDGWQKLVDYCRGLHGEINNPFDQSVRKGTQTTGKILSSEHPLMKMLKQQIISAVNHYIAKLPNDPNHPFLLRKSDDFHLSGNWSVRLHGSGHHVNHVHPKGWLSACLYIQVPPSTNEEDDTKKGWLTFGQSGLDETPENTVDQYVCPKAGKLVIFPAYFWHGTVPTEMTDEQNGERITIICDIEPLYKQ